MHLKHTIPEEKTGSTSNDHKLLCYFQDRNIHTTMELHISITQM